MSTNAGRITITVYRMDTELRYASGPGRWVLAATVLGSGIVAIDATVVGIALPAIGRDFGAHMATLQGVVTAYTMTLAGLLLVAGSLGDRYGRRLVFVIGVILFALGGTTYGMAEESLAFYLLIVTVMIAAGYDALTGAALILLGAGIGVLGSTINPFATGIASGFAGVSISEGLVSRVVLLVIGTAIGIWWVMRYAARVSRDPNQSLVAAEREANVAHFHAEATGAATAAEMTTRQKLVLVLFFLAFVAMIVGVVPWSDLGVTRIATRFWWFPEMTASFLLFAIAIGFFAGMSETRFTGAFVDGARDLLGVALIIGIARGVTVIMNNGQITDTVLNWAEQALSGLGGVAFATLTYAAFIPLSFLIPSSSGLATVAMPIMAPLASFANVPPSVVVTAYQAGNGLVNLVTPTSAVVMGGLAIARVPYGTWIRFVLPVLVILAVLTVAVLALDVLL